MTGLWTLSRLTLALLFLAVFSYGADWMLRAQNFPVRNVRFEGPFERVTPRELEAAVLDRVRGNFFLVDLEAVRTRVEALPWVREASVSRRLPRDLSVKFSEQRLVARWGEDAWVNAGGEVVRLDGAATPEGLPRLSGPEGSAAQVWSAYAGFHAALAPAGLRLTGVALAPRHSWRLEARTTEGERLTLVLDDTAPRRRLARFARVYPAALAARAAGVERVDLRYTNGFAVEWRGRGDGTARIAGAAGSRDEG